MSQLKDNFHAIKYNLQRNIITIILQEDNKKDKATEEKNHSIWKLLQKPSFLQRFLNIKHKITKRINFRLVLNNQSKQGRDNYQDLHIRANIIKIVMLCEIISCPK